VNPLDWTDVQGWAGIGGTKLGTTRFVRTASVGVLFSEIHEHISTELHYVLGQNDLLWSY